MITFYVFDNGLKSFLDTNVFPCKRVGVRGYLKAPPLCPCETSCMVWSTLCMVWQTSSYQCSVATKIENGLKTNAKILWIQNMDKDFLFLKMDWRLIWWLFVNSKFFEDIWRLLKIIEDYWRFFKYFNYLWRFEFLCMGIPLPPLGSWLT